MHRLTRPDAFAGPDRIRDYLRDIREALEAAGVGHGQDFYVVPCGEVDQLGGRFAVDEVDQPQLAPFAGADPDTSRLAAVSNYPRAGSQRLRVFEALALAFPGGHTRDELRHMLSLPYSSVTGRAYELEQGGFVAPSGRTRNTSQGSPADVLVLTEKGRVEWERRQTVRAAA
jgi:hypothetical protein